MQICCRRLKLQEIDHELVWLLVSLGAGAGLAAWLSARLPMPGCPFQSLTGFPCLTCGATRSAWQFLHGHFIMAFRFNPLAFLSYCGIAVFDLYAFGVLLTRGPRLRLEKFSSREKKVLRRLAVALLAGNWLYLIAGGMV